MLYNSYGFEISRIKTLYLYEKEYKLKIPNLELDMHFGI